MLHSICVLIILRLVQLAFKLGNSRLLGLVIVVLYVVFIITFFVIFIVRIHVIFIVLFKFADFLVFLAIFLHTVVVVVESQLLEGIQDVTALDGLPVAGLCL